MPVRFDHEKLHVYQASLKFVAWLTDLLEKTPAKVAAHGQLDRASTSVLLNIAEGNGRYTAADRCRFFDIARGSALECAAALDVLVAKRTLTELDVDSGKAMLSEIVAMLVGLIQSQSADRMHEEPVPYRIGNGNGPDGTDDGGGLR